MDRYTHRKSAFTLVELLCVIGIIAVIIAILIPVVVTTRRRGQSTACLSNIRQLSAAVQSYTQDYDGSYSAAITVKVVHDKVKGDSVWYKLLLPYTSNHVFTCPSYVASEKSSDAPASIGYALNSALTIEEKDASNATKNFVGSHESGVRVPVNTVTVFDARAGIIAMDSPDSPGLTAATDMIYNHEYTGKESKDTVGAVRHSGGANYGFADGHVRWLRPDAFVRECKNDKPCFYP